MLSIKNLRVKVVLGTLIPTILVIVAMTIITPYALEKITRDVVEQRDIELARILAARFSENVSRYSKVLQSTAAEEDVQSLEPDCLQLCSSAGYGLGANYPGEMRSYY